jgi:hypothetical protein
MRRPWPTGGYRPKTVTTRHGYLAWGISILLQMIGISHVKVQHHDSLVIRGKLLLVLEEFGSKAAASPVGVILKLR